ncbi:hypothetical protein GPECTOR_33g615 [Gonium pectorale]|uniref:Uncharacterized protein n=1 Tax=Gonium pectorale TaxID=33097 RepID=A0A150GD82_GONPE|nr:hypothetical protein GPECTOR_33g615 [Gonium pectorale]|eukprot:KXZ47733.1 hypothetical protein GPECTOR_33g615 [Gonium pectorale]
MDPTYGVGQLFDPCVRAFYASDLDASNIHCLAVLQPDDDHDDDRQRPAAADPFALRSALLDQLQRQFQGQLPLPSPAAQEAARRELSLCSTRGEEEDDDDDDEAGDEGVGDQDEDEEMEAVAPNVGPVEDPVIARLQQLIQAASQECRSEPTLHRVDPRVARRLVYTEPQLAPLLALAQSEAEQPPGCAGFSSAIGIFDTVRLGRPSPYAATCPIQCGAIFAAVAFATRQGPGGGGGGIGGSGSVIGGSGGGGGGGGAGPGSAAGDSAGSAAAAALSSALSAGLASLPCVQALNDARDAGRVLSASRSGLLPPVAAHCTNGWIEWIEFARPMWGGRGGASGLGAVGSREGADAAGARSAAVGSGNATGSSAAVAASGSKVAAAGTSAAAADTADGFGRHVPTLSLGEPGLVVRVMPVMWFRFLSSQELHRIQRDAAAKAAAAPQEGGGGARSDADAAGDGRGGGQVDAMDVDGGDGDGGGGGATAGGGVATSCEGEGGDIVEDGSPAWWEMDPGAVEPWAAMSRAAATAAALNAALAEAAGTGAAANSDDGGGGGGGGGGDGGGGGLRPAVEAEMEVQVEVQVEVQAVAAQPAAAFPLSPDLAIYAAGVAPMYGWGDRDVEPEEVSVVQLRQPWAANMLLAKLIDNGASASRMARGGANIDAAVVAVQGRAAPGGSSGGPVVRLMEGVTLA